MRRPRDGSAETRSVPVASVGHSSLIDLARLRSLEELGRHIAAVARARSGALEAELWVAREDARLRSAEYPRVVRTRHELGFGKLPCTMGPDAAPGSWRGRLSCCAVALAWGEELPGVLALGFSGPAPPLAVLASDLADALPAWSLALSRAVAWEAVSRADSAATARVGAGLAHTLSNVLQAALSSMETARGLGSPQALRAAHVDSIDALRRGSALVKQLAVLGGNADEPTPTELRSLVAGLAAALRLQMPPGIELELGADGDECWVLVDRGAIEATVAGIIFAAREALGAVGTIRVTTRLVADRGAHAPASPGGGIVEVEVRHLPLPSGDRTPLPVPLPGSVPDNRGGDTGGAGRLGMTFARVAVERYGGDVVQRSLEPGGAVTLISLPEVRASKRRASSGTMPRVHRVRTRVLVADDEPAVLRGVQRLLTSSGHDVLTARDGAEALKLARAHPDLDMALVDLTMPRLAGPTLVAALRGAAPDTPVVIMTGYASDEMVEALKREGVTAVLRKPVAAQTLLDAIQDSLTRLP